MSEITIFNTDLQNNVAKLLLAGFAPLEVATKCECSDQVVYGVLKSANYLRLAYGESMSTLVSEGSPAAVRALIDIVRNKKSTDRARITAADKILQHTGCVVDAQGRLEKNPANLTQAELQQRLEALQREALKRDQAAPIEGEKIVSKVSDMLD